MKRLNHLDFKELKRVVHAYGKMLDVKEIKRAERLMNATPTPWQLDPEYVPYKRK